MTSMTVWGLLVMAIVVSAVGVVYTKHQTRKLFADIQALEHQIDDHQVEWGRLQLELETWAERSRIEKEARRHLNMVVPDREETRYVRP